MCSKSDHNTWSLNNEELSIDYRDNVEGRCVVCRCPRSFDAIVLLATAGNRSYVEIEPFNEVDGQFRRVAVRL